MRFPLAAAILAASLSGAAGGRAPLRAQATLSPTADASSLHLELTKPFVSADGPFAGASFSTTAWDVTVAYPLGSGPTLFARMELLYASIEGLDGSVALTGPRVGASIASATGNRSAELHVDLPLATDFGETYATGIGIYSNFEEHERFLHDLWAVGANGTARAATGAGAFLGARVGGTVHFPDAGGTDVFARAAVYGDAPTDRTLVHIEFSSMYLVTRDGIDFSDRSTFFASLDVTWPSARFSPALFVRAPIDNTLDATVPIVGGLRLAFGG